MSKRRNKPVPQAENRFHPDLNRTPPGSAWRSVGIVALLGAATFAAYSNSFSAAFVFDDKPHIFANDRIRTVFPLTETLSGRRPMVDLTLALNYAVGRQDPTGYHMVNFGIHLLAGLTFFGLIRRLLRPPELSSQQPAGSVDWLAGVIALLWLLHPLQTQSVTYVIQRGESMMGLFYLVTLYSAVRGMRDPDRRHLWYAASAVACALGLATKAVMVTAPAVVFLYDWLIETRSVKRTLHRRWGLYIALCATWIILLLCGVAQGVLSNTPHPKVNVGFAVDNVTPIAYLMTQPGVILYYLRLVFWPDPLCIDYGWPLVTDASGAVIPGGIVLVLLAVTIWAAWRHPRVGFAGLCFFGILLPTSSFIPIRDPLFEHRMYLPLAAVLSLVVVGGAALGQRIVRRYRVSSAHVRLVTAATVALIAAALGARTFARNGDYDNELRLWQAAAEVRPQSARAHYSLAVALGRAKRYEESLRIFRNVLQVSTDRTRTDVLAEAHYHIGWNLIRKEEAQEAVASFRRAIEYNPEHVEATLELGFGLAMMKQYEEAIEKFHRTLELAPGHAKALEYLAAAEAKQQGKPGNQ